MDNLISWVKSSIIILHFERKFFAISFLGALCDVLVYIIVNTNLLLVVYKDSLDIDSSFHYILSSLKINFLFVFFLSFAIRFSVTSKLLSSICKNDLILSFLFSFVFVTANSYEQLNNSSLFLSSDTLSLLSFFVFCLVFSFSINVILFVRNILQLINTWTPRFPVFFEKHIFLYSFLFIFIAWLPYIIFRYPAGVEWDAYHQLMMFQGDWTISQHWPIVSTWFFGILFNVGKFIFLSNDNGIFFTSIVQAAICASCFSYSIMVQKRLSVSNGVIIFCLFSYAFLSIYPRYLTSIVKDALFSSSVLLLISFMSDLFYSEFNKIKKSKLYYLEFAAVIFLVCSLRHTGMYIILVCMFLSIIWFLLFKKRLCLTLFTIFLSSLFVFSSFSYIVSYHLGKNPLYPRMMYCLPLQQTARFISQNKNGISDEQIEIINNIFNFEKLIKSYNPKLCDPAIALYHADNISSQINYIKDVWLPFFFKDPFLYFAATYNQNEGFFFPFAKQASKYMNYYFESNLNRSQEPAYFSTTPSSLITMKKYLLFFIEHFESFFLFFFLCNCAVNNWAVLGCLLYSKKSIFNLLLLVPSLVIILTLIAGPTFYWNGERYALPIICCNLFLISILSKKLDLDKKI